MRISFYVIPFFLAFSAFAHTPKDGDIHATLGGFYYRTAVVHHEFDSPMLLGPAISAEADVSQYGGLEISMFYLHNSFSLVKNGLVITERVKRIYISTGYRHWLTDWFSAALAFSSSYAMGDYQTLRDDFSSGDHVTTSARDITEYGFDASLEWEPWHKDRYAAVIDGRYGYSITPKPGEDSNHYGVFIGVKYFVQSRQQPNSQLGH